MGYENGKFVWFELITPDADKAKAFYPEVVGWKVEPMQMGEGMPTYDLLKVGDAGIGGLAAPPKKGLPPHWVSYVSVDDVDATAKKAVKAGGKTLMDAIDIPGVGRMQPVQDPNGAAFFLFKAADGDPPGIEGAGAFHWNELWTDDVEASKKFYEDVLGYTIEKMDMPDGAYFILKSGDATRGGLMAAPEGAPTAWFQYVTVDDCDAALDRVKRLGGKPLGDPIDVPGVGRFAHVTDNQGAAIGLITPAPQG